MGGRGSKASRGGAGAGAAAESEAGPEAGPGPMVGGMEVAANTTEAQRAELGMRRQLAGRPVPPNREQAAKLVQLQDKARADGGLISNNTGAVVKPGFEAEHQALARRGVKIGATAYKDGRPVGRITGIGNKGGSVTVSRPRETVGDGRGGSRTIGGETAYTAAEITGRQ